MVKLIASDMDGTLLDPAKKFPPDFVDVLNNLKKRNIKFVVASGRSYSALEFLFKNIDSDIIYICDNGAFIVIENKIASISVIPHKTLTEIIKVLNNLNGVFPVLCGKNGIYIPSEYDDEFRKEFDSYYISPILCDDMYSVKDDIFKIAVYDRMNPQKNSFPELDKIFGQRLTIQISGNVWMDIMNQGINKGSALADIKRRFGSTTDQTMAFGDFYNDIDLLNEAKYSYVMANANDDMKQYGNFTAESNSEYGVTKAISAYLAKHPVI